MLREPSALEVLINKAMCWLFGCSYAHYANINTCVRCGNVYAWHNDGTGPRLLRYKKWWYIAD